MAESTSTEGADSAQYFKQAGFHKTFTLQATDDHGALDVSYSDLGRQPCTSGEGSESPPVVLFMPGMMASRFQGVCMGIVGEKLGVRILTVDRPGFGQSTEVKVAQRVSTWVEIVPQLLAHLGIQHVSLVSHSSGTMYLLNTLYSCRDVLSPSKPYAALLTPWVDVKHSGVMLLQTAQLIPNALFGSWNKVVQSIQTNIAPAVGSSLSLMGSWLPQSQSQPSAAPEMSKNRRHWDREYISIGRLDNILGELHGPTYKESTLGLNSEARLCLKKEGDDAWGQCEDVEIFCQKTSRTGKGQSTRS